jgi:3',5'-cyclic AMP phosphodiesterase CpdA
MKRAMLAFGVAVAMAAAVVVARYPNQTHAYLTHWKGAPSQTWSYEPLPDDPALRIAMAGDVGDSGRRIDATGAAMAATGGTLRPYDVLVLLGDNVYPKGDPAKLPDTVFGPFGAVLERGAELLAILGNHDVMDGHGDDQLAVLGMSSRWWSRSYGGTLIVGLDSTSLDDPEQDAFLERTLAETTATWRIVVVHHPPYSAGYQGSSIDVRERWSPVFVRHGVQLVVSGHDHDYQRSEPIDGVTYVVSGAAAGTRRTNDASFTARSFSWHHFLDVTVFDDRIIGRAVGQDGNVADEFLLVVGSVAPASA